MGEKKPNLIVIDNIEHDLDNFTDQQKMLVQHIADLDRKIASARFNLDQLTVGKDAFIAMLKTNLEAKPTEEVVQ
jgi:cell division septum initiation protein DivIVA